MKKIYCIAAVILSVSLLAACSGQTDEAAPLTPSEQPAVPAEAPDEKEKETKAEETEVSEEPEESVETDKIHFSFGPDVEDPDSDKLLRFAINLDNDYNNIESGFLFISSEGKTGMYDPTWEKEDKDADPFFEGSTVYVPVKIEGETGKEIKHSFEKMYTDCLKEDESFLMDKFNELSEEAASLKINNTADLKKAIGPLDISDEITKNLVFTTNDSDTIELPVISASLYPGSVAWYKKDLRVPYWDDGDKRYWLYGIDLEFFVPKESLNALKEYLTGQIQIAEADKEREEGEDIVDVTEESSGDDPLNKIPSGKNFDNVTGFEGYWYGKDSGKLDYVLFSDGTGWEISYIDGKAYDIEYSVGDGVLVVYGRLDTYYNFIIDENTLRDDGDFIRQPYHGGL